MELYLKLVEKVDNVGLGGETDGLARLEDVPEVFQPHDPVLCERVDLPYGDHVTEHVTQPLGVEKVQVSQGGVLVVQEETVFVEEFGGLVQLRLIPKLKKKKKKKNMFVAMQWITQKMQSYMNPMLGLQLCGDKSLVVNSVKDGVTALKAHVI